MRPVGPPGTSPPPSVTSKAPAPPSGPCDSATPSPPIGPRWPRSSPRAACAGCAGSARRRARGGGTPAARSSPPWPTRGRSAPGSGPSPAGARAATETGPALPSPLDRARPVSSPAPRGSAITTLSPMTVRVTLAGRVGVEVDGRTVDDGGLGRAARLALAYLVCERLRPVPRDELADILWGDDLPRSWGQLLRGIASKLRAVFRAAGLDPATALSTTLGTYRLELGPDVVVDVEDAARAVADAEAALARGEAGSACEWASLAVAVA